MMIGFLSCLRRMSTHVRAAWCEKALCRAIESKKSKEKSSYET